LTIKPSKTAIKRRVAIMEEFEFMYCYFCKEEKLTSEFYANSGICKDCQKIRRGVVQRNRILAKYGLTLEDYNKMLREQDGVCAICSRRQNPLHVDHNKRTGEVRGLLCMPCNTGLGFFGDNIGIMREAIKYLAKYAEDGPRLTISPVKAVPGH
jgi:hypothetical protein